MHSSSDDTSRPYRSNGLVTAGLTALVTLLLLGLAWLVPLETRNGRGEAHEMSAVNVWREMLVNIPADAPFFLNAPVLAVLSILALVGLAWVIVAIARLPR